jgi:hypothetical protein
VRRPGIEPGSSAWEAPILTIEPAAQWPYKGATGRADWCTRPDGGGGTESATNHRTNSHEGSDDDSLCLSPVLRRQLSSHSSQATATSTDGACPSALPGGCVCGLSAAARRVHEHAADSVTTSSTKCMQLLATSTRQRVSGRRVKGDFSPGCVVGCCSSRVRSG